MAATNPGAIAPSELIVPTIIAGEAMPTMSGALFLSGGEMYFALGTLVEKLSS